MSNLEDVEATTTSAPDGFHASRPRDEPLTTHGHQPGTMVGNDAAPEFNVETLPAGTAPPERTFKPDITGDEPVDTPESEAK